MKRAPLDKMLSEELEHIAKDVKGSDQNAFRMMYSMIRRRDLGRNPATPGSQSLRRAIEAIRESSRDFVPQYDEEYFSAHSASGSTT
jgi:hypothetical protein